MDPILQAYFSNRKAFVSVCPGCKHSTEFPPESFPRVPQSSIRHECACGRAFTIVPVGLRSCYRKPVNLAGGLRKTTEMGQIQVPCTIQDISSRGLQVLADMIKNVLVNDTVQMTVVLDDRSRTKLSLTCLVRRKVTDGRTMTLGLEITPAVGPYTEVLNHYTIGDANGHTSGI